MSIEGRQYDPVTVEIDAEHVAAFAWAIGADPADGVPPTYAAVYSLGVTAPQLFGDEEAAIDFAQAAPRGAGVRVDAPPRGRRDRHLAGRVTSDISRRGMRFVTFETDTSVGGRQAGVPLARAVRDPGQ